MVLALRFHVEPGAAAVLAPEDPGRGSDLDRVVIDNHRVGGTVDALRVFFPFGAPGGAIAYPSFPHNRRFSIEAPQSGPFGNSSYHGKASGLDEGIPH
jgi:hypothetical protein